MDWPLLAVIGGVDQGRERNMRGLSISVAGAIALGATPAVSQKAKPTLYVDRLNHGPPLFTDTGSFGLVRLPQYLMRIGDG
jgi:hypothetical protein